MLGTRHGRLHPDRLRLRFLRRGERAVRHRRSRRCRSSECAIACIAATACRRTTYPKVVALFNAKKDSIYALYRDPIGKLLPSDVAYETLKYFDEFYRVINDPKALKREIMDECMNEVIGLRESDRVAADMTGFRCELLSADQLAALASGPLPRGLAASEARRSLHRDLYLDTSDDSLRRRGIVCRLRTTRRRPWNAVALDLSGVERAAVGSRRRRAVPTCARCSPRDNAVVRRLRGVVDPAALEVRVDLEVDRLTRSAARDWLGRPRLDVHLDRITVRRGASGPSSSFFQMCAHQRRGDGEALRELVRALEEEHGVRAVGDGRARTRRAGDQVGSTRQRSPATPGSDRLYRTTGMRTFDGSPQFFNSELSLLSFQDRVLSLAEIAPRRWPSVSASWRSSARTSTSSSWCAWRGCRRRPAKRTRSRAATA